MLYFAISASVISFFFALLCQNLSLVKSCSFINRVSLNLVHDWNDSRLKMVDENIHTTSRSDAGWLKVEVCGFPILGFIECMINSPSPSPQPSYPFY